MPPSSRAPSGDPEPGAGEGGGDGGGPEERLGRALLQPGPLPPLSHLGASLLRHVLAAAVRQALHQLGLPMPEAPPVRIVRLRVYLDGAALERRLAGRDGGGEVATALLDPGGVAAHPLPPRLAAAATFHRWRLRLGIRSGGRGFRELGSDLRGKLRREVSVLAAAAGEAFLGELVAALERRARRRTGDLAPAVLGREAWRLRAGDRADLRALGPLDPREDAWSGRPGAADAAQSLAGEPLPPRHALRGAFREGYRRRLGPIAECCRRLGDDAARRGLVASPDDAFFLPWELASDLAGPGPAPWIAPAVEANRREHARARAVGSPPDLLVPGLEEPVPLDEREAWERAPLVPMP